MELKAKKEKVCSRVILDRTFAGLTFSPNGSFLYAGGGESDVVYQFHFEDGYLGKPRKLKVADKNKFIPGGLAIHPDGKTLFVTGVWAGSVCLLPVDNPEDRVTVPLGKDSYPINCLVDAQGKRLFVSLWNRAAVAVVDLKQKKVVRTLATEKHPTEMVLAPGEKTLFVACANSTCVSVLNVADGKGLETINSPFTPAPNGNTPASLSLTPDGQILFVANANANNLAVFNVADPGKAKPLGFIPVGMYPTSVRYHPANKTIYVTNGRGGATRANPGGPNPLVPKVPGVTEYIAGLYRGSLSVIPMPDAEGMIEFSKLAYKCSPLRSDQGVTGSVPKESPIPAKIGAGSPIKYCIYVIRENRTYDQVLGDVKQGNGDPNLCIFPEKITPNAHRLARQYVLLDNFYCDGEVSAEGHEWSMGAYCTDFVRRVWPLNYRGNSASKKSLGYPAEGIFDDIARPAGGYIWDRCPGQG